MFDMPGRRWRRSPPARAVAGYATTRTAMVAAGLLLVGLVAACAPPATGPQPPHAAVLEVIDGDTVVVRTGQTTEHVRLLGIDTPEIAHHGQPGDCFGAEAATRTAELLPAGGEWCCRGGTGSQPWYDPHRDHVLELRCASGSRVH